MNLSNIREHMKVVGADRQPVGTVDHVEGDEIKLAKNDPQAQGKHHYIPGRLGRRRRGRAGPPAQERPRGVRQLAIG